MANYAKITDFAAKDSMLSGNPLKEINGTAHDNEYNAISVAIATKVDTSGALGTPTSGTLTNCSGLPQSGVTGLTTADSPQFAGINLGHASDTTLTRVSAGVVAVEGSNVLLASGLGSVTQAYDADIPTVAASQAEMEAGSESALRSMSPLRVSQAVNGLKRSGEVIQSTTITNTSIVSSSAIIPIDGTTPQNTEGTQLFTVAITPTSASNNIRITAVIPHGSTKGTICALFVDSTADALAASQTPYDGTTVLRYIASAGSTSARTYKIRFGPDSAGTVYVCGSSTGSNPLGTTMNASMVVEEIKA